MSRREPGKIITFYSYKGGTGRSMVLANVGCILARDKHHPKRVLMVDWDLEAPGLHCFFRNFCHRRFPVTGAAEHEWDQQPGLIDLLNGLATARVQDGQHLEDYARSLLRAVPLQEFVIETDIPSVFLMKAGRFDSEYPRRVNTFDWQALYHRCPDLFRILGENWAEEFDYVLIDSRTGLNDLSGVCTMLLPDKLVVVFTPNRQSLVGGLDVIRRAIRFRLQSDDLRGFVVFPLASRVEVSEVLLRETWRYGAPGYQRLFEECFASAYGLDHCTLEPYFDEVQIQQSSRYAYGEELAAVLEDGTDRLSLRSSYEIFARWLAGGNPWETGSA